MKRFLMIPHVCGLMHLIKGEEGWNLNIFPFSKTFICQINRVNKLKRYEQKACFK